MRTNLKDMSFFVHNSSAWVEMIRNNELSIKISEITHAYKFKTYVFNWT